VAEFEVAVESVLDHFADFGMSYLPDVLSSVFQHGQVAVERTEKIVHVSKVTRQRKLVCEFIPLPHRPSFEERFIRNLRFIIQHVDIQGLFFF